MKCNMKPTSNEMKWNPGAEKYETQLRMKWNYLQWNDTGRYWNEMPQVI